MSFLLPILGTVRNSCAKRTVVHSLVHVTELVAAVLIVLTR